MLPEVVGAAFRHQMDGDAGSIGSDEGAFFAVAFDLFEELAFDVEPFYHDFNDPVAGRNAGEVVFKVARLDAPKGLFMK